MSDIPTPHIQATSKEEIAKTVLMPGDPLRAKFIAETYLEHPICFNKVRNMLGFTGLYNGKKVSVMGSGMGIPSIGLYSYELFHFYDVDTIIRVGSAGGISQKIHLRDLVIAMGACYQSGYAEQFQLPGTFAPIANYELLRKAALVAEEKKYSYTVGNVLSEDAFYSDNEQAKKAFQKMGVLAADMETAALYMNAARCEKNALSILTISDHLLDKTSLSLQDRQEGFRDMMELALEIA